MHGMQWWREVRKKWKRRPYLRLKMMEIGLNLELWDADKFRPSLEKKFEILKMIYMMVSFKTLILAGIDTTYTYVFYGSSFMIQFMVHWRIWRSGSQHYFPYICYNPIPSQSYDWSSSQLTGHFRYCIVCSEKGGSSLPSWHTLIVSCCVSAGVVLCVCIRTVIDFLFSRGARFTWTASDAPGKCPTCREDLLQYLEGENCIFQVSFFKKIAGLIQKGTSYHRLVP